MLAWLTHCHCTVLVRLCVCAVDYEPGPEDFVTRLIWKCMLKEYDCCYRSCNLEEVATHMAGDHRKLCEKYVSELLAKSTECLSLFSFAKLSFSVVVKRTRVGPVPAAPSKPQEMPPPPDRPPTAEMQCENCVFKTSNIEAAIQHALYQHTKDTALAKYPVFGYPGIPN